MITLMRGTARKSEYMQLLHRGTNNSVMILYGQDIPVFMSDNKEVLIYPRSPKTYTDMFELESDLLDMMANVLNNSDCRYLYLYGNFSVNEVDTLVKVANNSNVKPRLSIIATVQDNTVTKGQIVIEEIR